MSEPGPGGDASPEVKLVNNGIEKKNAEASSDNKAGNSRPRRRSNAKAEEVGGNSSRSGSRNNSSSENPRNNKDGSGQRAGRKEWGERKSLSQGGKGDGKYNHHHQHKDDSHKRTSSTNSTNGKRNARESTRTNSQVSNGDGYECSDEYELDEPFSDSDDDTFRSKQPQKMSLMVPRGRIRTLSGTVPITGHSPKWGGPTMCLSCLQFFDLPDQIEQFRVHLLKEHKIIVSEMAAIVDPKRYIEHWRQRFAKESVDKIFPRVEPEEGSELFGQTDYYYYLSEALPEDYSLRQRLAMRRLEEALCCQQRERDDASFQLQCIFCRYTARGNRSKIIHHLYMIHHLNLGSPDNLVFVTEYIEHLKEKLQRNECIYCEKTFQDRNTLMDHMRKRNHREVNPKNHYYDKFYIINYLELGKRWLDVLAEDFEDTMPTFQDSDEEDEDNSWCEWQEDNLDIDETRVLCLLCDESDEHAEPLLEHMKEKHDFDFLQLIDENKLDVYERMKLINYIRKQNFNAVCWVCQRNDLGNTMGLAKHIQDYEKSIKTLPDRALWNTEENLAPIFGNDHFLWMLESFLDERSTTEKEQSVNDEVELEKNFAARVLESQKNTVDGVIAEDLPDLSELTTSELEELK